jgi:hypothetical protein
MSLPVKESPLGKYIQNFCRFYHFVKKSYEYQVWEL